MEAKARAYEGLGGQGGLGQVGQGRVVACQGQGQGHGLPSSWPRAEVAGGGPGPGRSVATARAAEAAWKARHGGQGWYEGRVAWWRPSGGLGRPGGWS